MDDELDIVLENEEEKVDYQLDRAIDILHGIAVYQTRQES